MQHAMQSSARRSSARLLTPLKHALPLILTFAAPLRTWLPVFLCALHTESSHQETQECPAGVVIESTNNQSVSQNSISNAKIDDSVTLHQL